MWYDVVSAISNLVMAAFAVIRRHLRQGTVRRGQAAA